MMDDNVMNTYTSRASKASEFVQYDQGELSTTVYTCIYSYTLPVDITGYHSI